MEQALGGRTAPTGSTARRRRAEIFSIDTPPPTVSRLAAHGLGVRVHADRHHRPVPADAGPRASSTRWAGTTTGSPTERRVQNYFGVRCDPALPYDPAFEAPERAAPTRRGDRRSPATSSSCASASSSRTRRSFEELWRCLGLSVDWTLTYTTIGEGAASAARSARFLRILARGEAYQAEAPTLWDVDFRTAVAQAELEDRELAGAYHGVHVPPRRRRRASSSRPPGPSCSRPASRSSRTPTTTATSRCSAPPCRTPLFGVEVPVVAHPLADPEKGSGIAMICTFGDLTDVTWWRELQPAGPPHHRPGRAPRRPSHPDGDHRPDGPRRATPSSRARRSEQAQRRIVELLADAGELVGEPEADHAPGEVLREGRAAARDRHARASGTSATAGATPVLRAGVPGARPRAALASRAHARRATTRGSRG